MVFSGPLRSLCCQNNGPLLALFMLAHLVGCGSRTELSISEFNPARPSIYISDDDDSQSLDGGANNPDSSIDAGPDVETFVTCPELIQPTCWELVQYPEGSASNVRLAVIDRGNQADNKPASIGYAAISDNANFWHPEFRVGEVILSSQDPKPVSLSQPMTLIGYDAHAGGILAADATNNHNLSMVFYHGDEANPNVVPGLRYVPFNTSSWASGAEVDIDSKGESLYSLIPGASVENNTFAGQGYGVLYRRYRDDSLLEPAFSVINSSGSVVAGPVGIASGEEYPGKTGSISFNGKNYFAAVFNDKCDLSGPPCVEGTVSLFRIDASAAGLDLVHLAVTPPTVEGHTMGRPHIASFADNTWLLTTDYVADSVPLSYNLRLSKLDSQGMLVQGWTIAENVNAISAFTLSVNPYGVFVWWGENADTTLPSNIVGYARWVVLRFDPDGTLSQDPILIPITNIPASPRASVVAVDFPKAIAFGWAGTPEQLSSDVGYMCQLNCSQ